MNIFPKREFEFRLIDDQERTLNRLKRRTDKSKDLTSQITNKSFRGIINGNEFKLISSSIGKGAFCVMTGKIENSKGNVKVEINKAFRILLSILLLFPIIGVIPYIVTGKEKISVTLFLIIFAQLLTIRYVFIEGAFRILCKENLNRLRDVIDFEWIK